MISNNNLFYLFCIVFSLFYLCRMNQLQITDITVAQAKEVFPTDRYIADDIILFDRFSDVPHPTGPSRMRCLFLALCTQGKVLYTVDGMDREVSAGDVIIISEGQVVDHYLLSSDCNGISIIMSYDFFNEAISGVHELSQLFLFSRTHPVFRLTPDDDRALKEYFFLIKQKVDDKNHHFRKMLVSALIKSLIYDVSNVIYRIQSLSNHKKTRAEAIFTDFIKLVELNFATERRVGWYAKQLCITPKYLSESVKAVNKRCPNDWIDSYVMRELRMLLKNSPLSIKEIARQMNFANQSFMGRFFKERAGMAPREYRKM